MKKLCIPAASVKGFNYHLSYSMGSLEDWLLFDKEVWRRELTRGKEYFSAFNTVRIWLSWNAYCRMVTSFINCLKDVFDICRGLSLYVVPCLFNRWHDPKIDCDGIYIDHFLPDSNWLYKFSDPFGKYIDDLACAFKGEDRILVWDVCNEQFAYNGSFPPARTMALDFWYMHCWTCGCTDLHSESEEAVTEDIGNFAFVLSDGTVRPYHEIYNEI